MLRIGLILLLSLAACAPNQRLEPQRPESHQRYAPKPPGLPNIDQTGPSTTRESAAKGQVRSAEAQRLGRVGGRILSVAAEFCDSFAASANKAPGPNRCDYPLLVSNEGEANAFTDGRRVRVTRSLVRFAVTDDELAFTVAHEVAHNLLGHKARTLFGDPKRLEFEADRLGLQLVAQAGYNPEAAVRLLRRLAVADPGRDRPNRRYPSFSKRADVLQDLAKEVRFELSFEPAKETGDRPGKQG